MLLVHFRVRLTPHFHHCIRVNLHSSAVWLEGPGHTVHITLLQAGYLQPNLESWKVSGGNHSASVARPWKSKTAWTQRGLVISALRFLTDSMKVKVGCAQVCACTHLSGRRRIPRAAKHLPRRGALLGWSDKRRTENEISKRSKRCSSEEPREERWSLSAPRTNKSDKWLTPTAKLPDKLIIADSASHSSSAVTKLNL